MLSLKPPITAYSSLEDVGRFNMVWNVSLILIPVFFMLFVMHLLFDDDSWITSIFACVVSTLNILVLYRTRRYKLVGAWSVFASIVIVQSSVFIVHDTHLISDTMWCLLSAFFTFFIFGGWIGTFVLMLNLGGITIFLINGSSHDILTKGISVEEVDTKMVVNVFYVALALAYVIYQILKNNRDINSRYENQIEHNKVLMREIHHRVKNNLQIMSSLLKLQAEDTRSEVVKQNFSEAINRIRSMALIHEKMYQGEDLTKIDIEAYLVSLAKEITESIQSESNIEFTVSSDLHDIDVNNVVSVSLIFNELITNSVKHGFKDQRNGSIVIRIEVEGEDVIFDYRDNGKWIAPQKEDTFGLELISSLTEQLEGSFRRTTNDGTQYTFNFKKKKFVNNV